MRTHSNTLICLACYKDRLASVSENADEYMLFEIREGKIYPAGRLSLPSKDPMDRTSAILACGVTYFLCGAICAHTRTQLLRGGITVISWLTGSIADVLNAFSDNGFAALTMPGCRAEETITSTALPPIQKTNIVTSRNQSPMRPKTRQRASAHCDCDRRGQTPPRNSAI